MTKTFIATALLATCSFIACTKKTGTVDTGTEPSSTQGKHNPNSVLGRSSTRLSGPNYSKSIPVDTANRLILSYLTGVGYPSVDTSIRALSFDADTLRSYLANNSITTVKFMFAHQPGYVNTVGFGQNTGLNPAAVTLVIVGLNDNDQYVLNSQGGVYDNMSPCPLQCLGTAGSTIQ